MTDRWIERDDGSAAMRTASGAWIDYARPGPSQLDRLAADAEVGAALEEWRKSRRSAPWWAPVVGAVVVLVALGGTVGLFLLALRWHLG